MRHWFKSNKREFLWRKTPDPYEILVAEILLQQTDASKVKRIFPSFINAFPDFSKLAKANLLDVMDFISQIGLDYRATRLIKLAQIIESEFNGKLPGNRNDLLLLPGIGPYISNALLSIAFHKRVSIVDTNVIRIYRRFFGLKSSRTRPRSDPVIWSFADRLLPRQATDCKNWNYSLLDFAAIICRQTKSKCFECPCFRKCVYFNLPKVNSLLM